MEFETLWEMARYFITTYPFVCVGLAVGFGILFSLACRPHSAPREQVSVMRNRPQRKVRYMEEEPIDEEIEVTQKRKPVQFDMVDNWGFLNE